VKDPREVVKAGDIVKVKVLEVDVARKRIALTRRLEDAPGQPAPRQGEREPRGGGAHTNAARDAGSRGGNERGSNDRGRPAPRQQAAPFDSAIADALKGLRRS
jgi:uncharacterized protein